MPYVVQKSSCEVAIFLCGICLFIFFAGLAVYIYIHYSSTSYEKSIIETLLRSKNDDVIIQRNATNLHSRPFLHNSTIPLVLIFILIFCHLSYQDNNMIMTLTILIVAFTTHHFRDAYRRGLTFFFYQTSPLPYYLYIGLILITPYLLKSFIVKDVKYRKITSNSSQLIIEV